MTEVKNLDELFECLLSDTEECRIVTRLFFVNSISTYYKLIDRLSQKADITTRLSDDLFCKGRDVIPDIRELTNFLNENEDKTILIPHIGEYLHIGEKVEKECGYLYSLINRHVHSRKRVWIPIFAAKGLFQSVVGELDDERFSGYMYELVEEPSEFNVTVYSNIFANYEKLVNARGIKEWFSLWDDGCIKSGLSYSTRQIKHIRQYSGDYTLSVIQDPFSFIKKNTKSNSPQLVRNLGTDEQWACLVPFVDDNTDLRGLLLRGLNQISFDSYQLLSSWKDLDSNKRWLFKLWYELELNSSSDYISTSVLRTKREENIPESIETTILDYLQDSVFEKWNTERKTALSKLGSEKLSKQFWNRFREIEDVRTKLKLLTNTTYEEKVEFITIISQELSSGSDIKSLRPYILNICPDLLIYLEKTNYIKDEALHNYISHYKRCKISNTFNSSISKEAGQIDIYSTCETRGKLLNNIRMHSNAYYLWVDGMGIEWIDLLVDKVKKVKPELVLNSVEIGTAIIPTITSINMKNVDPDTISEPKFDQLDALSHIKDNSDTNYYSIIAKQFALMDKIATWICNTAEHNPDKDIVITSDHGMSRMAAIAFHETDAILLKDGAEIYNHGRYADISKCKTISTPTNTIRKDNILAFQTHNHFSAKGKASGEIHGGAAPEELFVPVIKFNHLGTKIKKEAVGYQIPQTTLYLSGSNAVDVVVITDSPVEKLTIEIKGQTLSAVSSGVNSWTARVKGLEIDHDYVVRVYPDNIYSDKENVIHIGRKGLVVDDDF